MLLVKRDFFLQSHFKYFFLTSFLSSVLTSHSSCNNQVSEVSKIVLTLFMMSEARSATAVENVVFFSKWSIVIKLPVKSKLSPCFLFDLLSFLELLIQSNLNTNFLGRF